MKKSSKYNLLAKDEPLKEKEQQDWVELESVNKWKQQKSQNHDTSYMKLEEEYSEIEGDNVHLNKGYQNSSYVPNGSQNSQQYKPQSAQNVPKPIPQNVPNQRPVQKPQQKATGSASNFQQPNQTSYQPQRSRQTSQIPSQMPPNSYNSQYVMNPPYIQRSLIPSSFVNNHLIPNVAPYVPTYSVVNVNVPPIYSQYQPQGYMPNQGSYLAQSQFQPNNGYRNSQPQYQYQSSIQPNVSRSSINQPNRASHRSSVPEMTVNCGKCTFTQSVPGNAQMFICCMCNEIDECFPLYGVFTCGICKAKVIYPHGTSSLIKCTKCQTVNRVNPEPKKKQDENVVMGKEQLQVEQPILPNEQKSYEESEDDRMRRDEPESFEYKLPQKDMKKNFQQPFKILPAKKVQEKPSKQQEINLYPEMDSPKQVKREADDRNKQFNEQLIELGSNQPTGNQNLHKEILELSEKLDESLVLGTEDKHEVKVQIPHPNQSSPLISHQPATFPSIFD